MKMCIECGATFHSTNSCCPACGYKPEIKDKIPLYAPAFAKEGGGFKSTYFQELYNLESEYFWFRARNKLIIWAIGKYSAGIRSFLEIGCGTGYVLSEISEAYPEVRFQGAELFTAGLEFAAARQPKIPFMQMDARQIPFVDEFDAIGAFDVLEHIEEDEQVLKQMHNTLKAEGIMFLTVPQHMWLWSAVDEYACHVRRYSEQELHAKVEHAGFEILRSTSFVFSLLPAMWVSRFFQRSESMKIDPLAEFRMHPWVSRFLEKVMRVELSLIRYGINFPLGGSRLIVARKQ